MKKVLLCLSLALAIAGCHKPAAEDDDSSAPSTSASKVTPAPRPKSGDWMWKDDKGKAYADPFKDTKKLQGPDKLSIPSHSLNATPKK